MKKSVLAVLVSLSFACGSMPTPTVDSGVVDAGPPKLDTAEKIFTLLEGKTLTMEGMNIPLAPNGYNRNVFFGTNTQCYNKTVIKVMARNFQTSSSAGTWTGGDGGVPTAGTIGMCNTAMPFGNPLSFNSMNVVIENVKGDAECFDVNVDYGAFKQEGRASISADRATVNMELFFQNQATGHRCADGNPGAMGVKVQMNNLTFDAVQKYAVTQ